MRMNGNTSVRPIRWTSIFMLMITISFTGCIFQSDETPQLNNPLDPNSDAYEEAEVSELNIESGQKFYTSEITVTWKGSKYASEYQCVLGDSSFAWITSSWTKLTNLTSGEYLFMVTSRNQAGFSGQSVYCLFTILESPAVDSLSIENGQVFTIPDVEVTWTGNTTANSYHYSLNDEPSKWSDITKASFEGLDDGVYTLAITAKNEDVTGAPKTWIFIVDTTSMLLTTSGTVTGADEVTILLGGDTSEARITGEDGSFSFNVVDGGTYTLTPTLEGYSFTPESANIESITTNNVQNFTATLNSYTISGTLNGADVVTIELTGDAEESVTLNDGDSYSFTVDALGDYLIIPRKDKYETIPNGVLYVKITQDLTQNFEVESAAALTLSGLVTGLNEVYITLSGDRGGTQIVDDNYRYEFIGEKGGTYTVSIFKEECMVDV